MSSEVKVGAVVLAALAALATGIFLLGERSNLFALKSRYSVQFATVSGLEAGNPVQLNGVTVGRVEEVVLPQSIEEQQLTVWISLISSLVITGIQVLSAASPMSRCSSL